MTPREGKALEQLVAALEKAVSDSSDLTVHSLKVLPDRTTGRLPSTESGEEQDRVFMSQPIAAEQMVGFLWKRNIAILGALAPVDMNHHSFAVDVGDLKRYLITGFTSYTATGIGLAGRNFFDL